MSFVVPIPLIKEVEHYPRFLDPRDPDGIDKAQQRLGEKYILCLKTMLKAKNWGENPNTTVAYIRQFIRQQSNPNLKAEELSLIREILKKYKSVHQQIENEEAAQLLLQSEALNLKSAQ